MGLLKVKILVRESFSTVTTAANCAASGVKMFVTIVWAEERNRDVAEYELVLEGGIVRFDAKEKSKSDGQVEGVAKTTIVPFWGRRRREESQVRKESRIFQVFGFHAVRTGSPFTTA